MRGEARAFLRIPPFPGARVQSFAVEAQGCSHLAQPEVDGLLSLIRRERVGGSYWGKQPPVPSNHKVVSVRDPVLRAKLLRDIDPGNAFCCDIRETYDPWHLVTDAAEVIADADDELILIAAIAGVPALCVGEGRFAMLDSRVHSSPALSQALRSEFERCAFIDPFTGSRINPHEAVKLSGFWRQLIDSNRDLTRAFGVARWKRPTVAPLLWSGERSVRFGGSVQDEQGGAAAVWRSRVRTGTLQALQADGCRLVEIEDGFIRSSGLGADCVPPQSIIVDRRGIYFDPAYESDLEHIIQTWQFSPELLGRARELRELIVASGISKYEASRTVVSRKRPGHHSILVPGQVEDDRAVIVGGQGLTSNLELLRRVRSREQRAHIIYKPHPDVEAGHRKGAIPDEECLAVADEIVREGAISQLIDRAREVHVNTSLAGFEALLRGKPVTTHGLPFYAGWGLTTDLGAVPDRRSARRTVDELVAAALIVYPRYVDPRSGLPCPPEVLVNRLAEGPAATIQSSPLVWMRRLQGRTKRRLAKLAR